MKFFLIASLVTLSFTSALNNNNKYNQIGLQVLVYETEKEALGFDSPSQRLVDQINNDNIKGIHATIFGQGSNDGAFVGYGSKFTSSIPILTAMSKNYNDTLVVLTDSRDILVNNPFNDTTYSNDLVNEFRLAFEDAILLKPNAIIISAEAQCCVSALTHIPLGGYYNDDGSRKNIACSSGTQGCLWAGDEKAATWASFMNDRMIEQCFGNKYDDAYLNAGLIVGKPKDLLRIILAAQIHDEEDDQAVLTDYMYHNPNDIVLDYQQKLFGNNRGGIASIDNGGCVFQKQPHSKRLVHVMTQTQPLFLHSPGAFFACHDQMSDALGVPKVGSIIRRKLRIQDKQRRVACNYGQQGADCSDKGYFGGLFDLLGLGGDDKAVTSTSAPVSPLIDALNRDAPTAAPNSLINFLPTSSTGTTTSLTDALVGGRTTPAPMTSLATLLGFPSAPVASPTTLSNPLVPVGDYLSTPVSALTSTLKRVPTSKPTGQPVYPTMSPTKAPFYLGNEIGEDKSGSKPQGIISTTVRTNNGNNANSVIGGNSGNNPYDASTGTKIKGNK